MKYFKRVLILLNVLTIVFTALSMVAAMLMALSGSNYPFIVFGGVLFGGALGFIFREQVQAYTKWLSEK